MEEIARATPRVLAAPDAPGAFVASLGTDGILLELGFWIDDPEKGQLMLRSAINRALLKAFVDNDIRMPVTQRDIRIVSGAEALARPGARPDL
jgi:small-conductance mechanosensitive channel